MKEMPIKNLSLTSNKKHQQRKVFELENYNYEDKQTIMRMKEEMKALDDKKREMATLKEENKTKLKSKRFAELIFDLVEKNKTVRFILEKMRIQQH